MTVEVRVTASLQKLVGGEKAVQGQGETVGQVLTDLSSASGQTGLTEDGPSSLGEHLPER
jgi:hypothetical protein